MSRNPLKGLLDGIVIVDETFVGGKPRKKGLSGKKVAVGRGERDGMARVRRSWEVLNDLKNQGFCKDCPIESDLVQL